MSVSPATAAAISLFPPTAPQGPQRHKHTCSLCARRKVKCDKVDPCSNCLKAKVQCFYETPVPPRPRKRVADEELLTRLALYEELMRKHDIDFAPSTNILGSSRSEVKLKETGQNTRITVSQIPATGDLISTAHPWEDTTTRCLWSNLSVELKHPPIQSLRHKDDPVLHPTPSLHSIFFISQPEIHQLHPKPRHIYRLWQIFIESVNPFTKIVHVPTLQQRVLDASWDVANVSNPMAATLFAIYTLAVTSISSDDCQISFGETRGTLLARYRAATIRALMANDFLTTRDFEVLQAFVLFLFADPESELTSTLTGAAIRLGQKMGLHRENPHPSISFFEQELRVRLWWQLHGLDSRIRFASTQWPKHRPPQSEFGEVRFPLNINDADLHPYMIELPVEHNTPTEMICVLMKFELFNWLRSSPTVTKVFDNIIQGPDRGKMAMSLKDEAINELEAMYREKHLRNSDKRIPLHGLTHAMANLMVALMRFKAHHPRGRAAVGNDELHIAQEESNILFDSAVTSLEMVSLCMDSKFSSHLFAHLTSSGKLQMDSYIYVLSELRRRCSGDQVRLAWKLVEDHYEEHPELIEDVANTFYVAFGELTLEAWEARRKELVRSQDIRESLVTPQFIQSLRDRRKKADEQNVHIPTAVADSLGLDGLGLTYENNLDWEYWNDFLTL